ncbi:MAG TPA: hypothetical protein VNG90_02490 [Candidatus Acidoferrum sp.]|nr:hypothetical protein [Candidatus Acidoferrum sp.]
MPLSRQQQFDMLMERMKVRFKNFETQHMNDLLTPIELRRLVGRGSDFTSQAYAKAFPNLGWEFLVRAIVDLSAANPISEGRSWKSSLSIRQITNAVQQLIEGVWLMPLEENFFSGKVPREEYPTYYEAAEMVEGAITELSNRGFLWCATTTTVEPAQKRYILSQQCIEHLYLTTLFGIDQSPYSVALLGESPEGGIIGHEPSRGLSEEALKVRG